jgi:hypothetical protein
LCVLTSIPLWFLTFGRRQPLEHLILNERTDTKTTLLEQTDHRNELSIVGNIPWYPSKGCQNHFGPIWYDLVRTTGRQWRKYYNFGYLQ